MYYFWYGDDSELTSTREIGVNDVQMFGGYLISYQNQATLLTKIQAIKKALTGFSHPPVKWNMKDLEAYYTSKKRDDVYLAVMAVERELKLELLKLLASHASGVVISAIAPHSTSREVVKKSQGDLKHYSFVNVLQRVGARQSRLKADGVLMILDWPTGGQNKSFIEEYFRAHGLGLSCSDSHHNYQKYDCGPLKELNFYPSPLFSVTKTDPLLQLSDLVLGAYRDLITQSLQRGKAAPFYQEAIQILAPTLDISSVGQVSGYGLVLSGRKMIGSVDWKPAVMRQLNNITAGSYF